MNGPGRRIVEQTEMRGRFVVVFAPELNQFGAVTAGAQRAGKGLGVVPRATKTSGTGGRRTDVHQEEWLERIEPLPTLWIGDAASQSARVGP